MVCEALRLVAPQAGEARLLAPPRQRQREWRWVLHSPGGLLCQPAYSWEGPQAGGAGSNERTTMTGCDTRAMRLQPTTVLLI